MQQTTPLSRDVKLQRELGEMQEQAQVLASENRQLFDDNCDLVADYVELAKKARRLKLKNTALSWVMFFLVLGFFMMAGLWDVWSWGILVGIALAVISIWFGSEA